MKPYIQSKPIEKCSDDVLGERKASKTNGKFVQKT